MLLLDNYESLKNNNFIKYSINSKKIQKKNVKFDIQTHISIDYMLSGLDRLFRL